MKDQTSLFVFRRDLRITDNTGLMQALRNSEQVVVMFVLDAYLLSRWHEARYRLSFLCAALLQLQEQLAELGGTLLIRQGEPIELIPAAAREFGATHVYMNRDYGRYARRRDREIYERCQSENVQVTFHADQLLQEPEHVLKGDGTPYQVFTPFYRAAARLPVREPASCPTSGISLLGCTIETRELVNTLGSPASLDEMDPAKQIGSLNNYAETRDFPGVPGTSRIASLLRFGLVSPREVYRWAGQLEEPEAFRRQLYWRDFYHHIGWHFPHVYRGNFRSRYDGLTWLDAPEHFQAWVEGRTGFPIVDAGMRELKATGYMHNRVRMVVASFLTKNLQINWRRGEAHFARYLIDFDPAVNNGNWQWSASTGCDAQPYFRIFNPWRQQKRFDPECTYIRDWVPELRELDAKTIHGLEKNPSAYMPPVVDLKISAAASIDRFNEVR